MFSIIFRNVLPMFVFVVWWVKPNLLFFLFFCCDCDGVYSSCCVHPLSLSALLYGVVLWLKMLDEFSDSLRLIDLSMCLIIEVT